MNNMAGAAGVIFPPGTEVKILNGNSYDRTLLPTSSRYQVISYDDWGIIVSSLDGPAPGRKFYISKSTPIIMMEAD